MPAADGAFLGEARPSSSPAACAVSPLVLQASAVAEGPANTCRVAERCGSMASEAAVSVQAAAPAADGLVRRAAVLRLKYRKHPQLVRLPLDQVGFHPSNRDGQGPSADRCAGLLADIIKIGFDATEADTNGVVVEQRQGSSTIAHFNARVCDGDSAFAPVIPGAIAFGSLSHSHLNQILKNIKAGVQANVPSICDLSGRLSVQRLHAIDAPFAAAVTAGLLWEILASDIDVEEPEACSIIQSALNAKNSLFLLAHEMQAVSRMITLTTASAVAEARLSCQAAQLRLRETLPQFADDANFLDLYSFVIDLGAGRAPFLSDLKRFHEKFVDPMLRRVRLTAFQTVNTLPLDWPHLKVAAVKYMYIEGKLSQGFCTHLTAKQVRVLLDTREARETSAVAEAVLQFFHVQCLDAMQTLAPPVATKFFGNVDKDVFATLLGAASLRGEAQTGPAEIRAALLQTGATSYRRLHKCLGSSVAVPAWPWPAAPAQAARATVAPQAADLAPRLIEYSAEGKPLCAQDVLRGAVEDFKWRPFMDTACVTAALHEDQCRAAVIAALHRRGPCA